MTQDIAQAAQLRDALAALEARAAAQDAALAARFVELAQLTELVEAERARADALARELKKRGRDLKAARAAARDRSAEPPVRVEAGAAATAPVPAAPAVASSAAWAGRSRQGAAIHRKNKDSTDMNVFVLCTGRSGSATFTRAAKHITNFTAGHESRGSMVGEERLAYPPRHIEIDNRLSWLLGRLDRAYGERARYVHLIRDPEATAASFTERERFGIFKAYRTGIIQKKRRRKTTTLDLSRDLVDTITQNILVFLRDKPHVMTFPLEDAAGEFPKFWDWIGAEGDLAAASAEWGRHYNASKGTRRKGRSG